MHKNNGMPANDNASGAAQTRVDTVVIRIARLIGRQMAREAFQARPPANDNRRDDETAAEEN